MPSFHYSGDEPGGGGAEYKLSKLEKVCMDSIAMVIIWTQELFGINLSHVFVTPWTGNLAMATLLSTNMTVLTFAGYKLHDIQSAPP